MKHIYNYLVIIGVVFLFSCSEQLTPTFDESVIGLQQTSQLVFLRDGSGPVPAGITVQNIGSPSSGGVNFTITVNSSSTAIEGTHFTLDGNSGSIPAGNFEADLPITILPDNIEAGEVWTLDLNLSSSDADVAPFAENFSYDLLITCENSIPIDRTWTASVLQGAFGAFSTRNDVTITDAGDGTLFVSDISAGVLPALGCCDADEGAFINNICDQITIARADPGTASFPYETNADAGFGPGTWDPVNQVLIINWWEPGNAFGATVELIPN